MDRPLLLRITIFTDMPLQQFRECLFTHIFYPDPGKRTSGIFPFSYSPNDHLLTAKIHNHLCKDLRTHRELVNHRELCCKITLFADKFSLTAVVDPVTAKE